MCADIDWRPREICANLRTGKLRGSGRRRSFLSVNDDQGNVFLYVYWQDRFRANVQTESYRQMRGSLEGLPF